MKPDVAQNTVRPGDVVVTVGGHVVRAADVEDDDHFLGVRYYVDDSADLAAVSWMDVESYHPREKDPLPRRLVESIDAGVDDMTVLATVDDGGKLTPVDEPADTVDPDALVAELEELEDEDDQEADAEEEG